MAEGGGGVVGEGLPGQVAKGEGAAAKSGKGRWGVGALSSLCSALNRA